MRTKFIIISIVSTILAINFGACAQGYNNQNNSNTETVRNYDVEQFNEIKSETVASIIYTQSEELSVRAEGYESDIENLEVSFNDGELKLKSKIKNKKANVKLNIYITSPNIVKINHQGVGAFTLKDRVSVDELEIDYEGVGNLASDNLECTNLKVEFQGVGNMNLTGSAINAEFKSEGVGNLNAKDFEVDNLVVKASGVGNVKCRASKTIDISSDGIGSVTYWGDAEVKDFNKRGLGKVSKGK